MNWFKKSKTKYEMVIIFDSNCRKMPAYQIAHFCVEDDFTKEDLTHQMAND